MRDAQSQSIVTMRPGSHPRFRAPREAASWWVQCAAVCALAFLAGGCSPSPETVIEVAISQAKLGFAGLAPTSWESLSAYPSEQVVEVAERLLEESNDSNVRLRAIATLKHYALTGRGRPFKERLSALARIVLFDRDPQVAEYAIDILISSGNDEDVHLIAKRLQSARDPLLVRDLFGALRMRNAWAVIVSELNKSFPEGANDADRQDWYLRMTCAMEMFHLAKSKGTEITPEVLSRIVSLIEHYPRLSEEGVRSLVAMEATSAVPDLRRIFSETDSLDTKLAVVAGLIILDKERTGNRSVAVEMVRRAVANYQRGAWPWDRAILPIKWLAFAAFGSDDFGLLLDVWRECAPLDFHRKADILCEMARDTLLTTYLLVDLLATVSDEDLLQILVYSPEFRSVLAFHLPFYSYEKRTPQARVLDLQAQERRVRAFIRQSEVLAAHH